MKSSLLEAGYSKKSIRKVKSQEAIDNFLYLNTREVIKEAFGSNFGTTNWIVPGKRFVQLEETRLALRFCLRNSIWPQSKKALILLGEDPAEACILWAKSGLVNTFFGYEEGAERFISVVKKWKEANNRLGKALAGLGIKPDDKNLLKVFFKDCFAVESTNRFGVIDLDFCNNRFRTEAGQTEVYNLLARTAPTSGPVIFRTTLHVGRHGNTEKDVLNNIYSFEDKTLESFRTLVRHPSRYQSTLPMISMLWILERKENENLQRTNP